MRSFNYYINSYISSSKEQTVNTIKNLVKDDFKNVDCFIIKSSQGNGGTHLLQGTFELLKEHKKKIAFYNAERVLTELNKNKKELESYFLEHQYVAIDDFQLFYFKNFPNTQFWIENLYDKLLINKKKLLLTLTENSINEINIPNFLFKGKIKTIESDYPLDKKSEIIENTFKESQSTINPEIFKYLISQNFPSVRFLKNICISIIAKTKNDNKNIGTMNLNEFKNLYQKYIDIIYK